jgi:hypothetical protein
MKQHRKKEKYNHNQDESPQLFKNFRGHHEEIHESIP